MIEQDMFNQIASNGGNYTVLSLVEKYVSLKIGVRHNTKAGDIILTQIKVSFHTQPLFIPPLHGLNILQTSAV